MYCTLLHFTQSYIITTIVCVGLQVMLSCYFGEYLIAIVNVVMLIDVPQLLYNQAK